MRLPEWHQHKLQPSIIGNSIELLNYTCTWDHDGRKTTNIIISVTDGTLFHGFTCLSVWHPTHRHEKIHLAANYKINRDIYTGNSKISYRHAGDYPQFIHIMEGSHKGLECRILTASSSVTCYNLPHSEFVFPVGISKLRCNHVQCAQSDQDTVSSSLLLFTIG